MILVTGATGCLGSNVTRALVRGGEEVAILRRGGDDLAAIADVAADVRHRIGDVRDPDAVAKAHRGVDVTYHLAGFTIPANRFAKTLYDVNVLGTENVARAALRQGARMVHTSSVSAIGFPDAGEADEQFTFNAHGHAYAVSKHLGERVVQRHVADGLDAVILNPAATMAPGGDLRVGWAALVMRLRAGRLRAYPGGGLSMATRHDLVDAYLRAMRNGKRGERYIVSSVDVTYAGLLRMAAGAIGVSPPRLRMPDPLIRLGAKCGATVAPLIGDPRSKPLLSPENVRLLTSRMFYNPAKARRELGLQSTSLVEAIKEVARWCDACKALTAR